MIKKLALVILLVAALLLAFLYTQLMPGEATLTPPAEDSGDRVTTIGFGHFNAYLIRADDGHILVDTGMPGGREALAAAMAEAGVEPTDVSLIVATHTHLDHVGSIADAKALTGADVLCHENAAELLRAGESAPVIAHDLRGRFLNLISPTSYDGLEPDIVFDDAFDLGAYGVDGQVIHTPGHTQDSVSVALDSGELLIGDIVRGDADNIHLGSFYEDVPTLMRSLDRLVTLNARKIYMSHGPAIDQATFRQGVEDLKAEM